FFNDTATTEIYTTRHTLSLHDALPISASLRASSAALARGHTVALWLDAAERSEEHTSELQSRRVSSYAVFCLRKKKEWTKVSTRHIYAPSATRREYASCG